MPPSKKKSAKKRPKKEEVTYSLSLTKDELTHVRNIMSVVLPPTGEVRLGESLAEACDMDVDVDTSLWDKVWSLCEEVGIEVGEAAPDFVVAHADATLKVYQVALQEDEEQE